MPPSSVATEHEQVLRGILWMMLATMLWAGSDAIVKNLTNTYGLIQILWARYTFHVAAIVLLMGPRVRVYIRSRRPALQLIRSSLTLCSTALFFAALHHIPLAETNAVFATAPILVTILSVPLLGEQVGMRRWLAVAAGFVGTLLIIRPGTEAMHPAMFLVLGSAGINAFYQIATRYLSRSDPALTTVIYTPAAGWIGATLAVPFFWTPPDAVGWALMIVLGLCSGGGHSAFVKAFETAPASAMTPFTYASLMWATLFGFVFFGDLPDAWTIAGATILAGSGIYIVHRERLRAAKPGD